MTAASETRGKCEIHGEYAITLEPMVVKSDGLAAMLPTALESKFLTHPFMACFSCREIIKRVAADKAEQVTLTTPTEDSVQIALDERSSMQERLVKRFSDLKKIFPNEIRDIFVIPEEEVAGTVYAQKLNILVAFKSLSILDYTRFVLTEKKSAMHLWNKPALRSKYISSRCLRILIGLANIHLSSTEVAVWVMSYTRTISMDFFCTTPPRMEQLKPSRLLKVN
jgi:hypothetical protein